MTNSTINRLSTQRDIKDVIQNGRRFQKNGIGIRYILSTDKDSSFAVLLSGAVWKKAFQRNKVKRLVREYLRGHKDSIRKGLRATISVSKLSVDRNLTKSLWEKMNDIFTAAGLMNR